MSTFVQLCVRFKRKRRGKKNMGVTKPVAEEKTRGEKSPISPMYEESVARREGKLQS